MEQIKIEIHSAYKDQIDFLLKEKYIILKYVNVKSDQIQFYEKTNKDSKNLQEIHKTILDNLIIINSEKVNSVMQEITKSNNKNKIEVLFIKNFLINPVFLFLDEIHIEKLMNIVYLFTKLSIFENLYDIILFCYNSVLQIGNIDQVKKLIYSIINIYAYSNQVKRLKDFDNLIDTVINSLFNEMLSALEIIEDKKSCQDNFYQMLYKIYHQAIKSISNNEVFCNFGCIIQQPIFNFYLEKGNIKSYFSIATNFVIEIKNSLKNDNQQFLFKESMKQFIKAKDLYMIEFLKEEKKFSIDDFLVSIDYTDSIYFDYNNKIIENKVDNINIEASLKEIEKDIFELKEFNETIKDQNILNKDKNYTIEEHYENMKEECQLFSLSQYKIPIAELEEEYFEYEKVCENINLFKETFDSNIKIFYLKNYNFAEIDYTIRKNEIEFDFQKLIDRNRSNLNA